jgi:hypothetical protein
MYVISGGCALWSRPNVRNLTSLRLESEQFMTSWRYTCEGSRLCLIGVHCRCELMG